MDRQLHVVFGAGQVGATLAEALLRAGRRVRIVRRSTRASVPGAEIHAGDASDPAVCIEAARDATSIYHCMNPAYDTAAWATMLPRAMDNLIGAAARSGARLVVLDNLYMLGDPRGQAMNEDTPIAPCSRKGEIRARVAQRLSDAHRRGDVRAVSGRASDFYGPRGALTYAGDHFWKPALAGRVVRLPIDPDRIHTYHYIPDVAAGLAALGAADDDVLGIAWMLPCRPAGPLRDLVDGFAAALGRDIRIARMPTWSIRALGVAVPLMREMAEMLYQWDGPFVVDDRRFRTRFGTAPVDAETAARATVAWARDHYAAG